MSRHFTLPTVLRMTPNHLLQEFFHRLGARLISLDWHKLGEWQVEPLLLALGWLPAEDRGRIEAALAQIFELACEEGWRSILAAAGELGETTLVLRDAGWYERAMWTWLSSPEVFEQALFHHRVENVPRWRKRTGLPLLTPRITPDSLRELAAGLSQCLQREEGRGYQCSLEYHRRLDGTDYFAAYPDDFVQTITMHDEAGRLIPRQLRQTFELVFALRAHEGVLELSAQVAPPIKPKLECVFGQIILGADLGEKSSGRPYDLNRLKDRYFCLETDPADRVSASISRLRLDVPRYGKFTVEPESRGAASDIYEVIDECLSGSAVHWDEVKITLATFRFEFQAAPRKRASTLTLDVTYPDHCSIKSRRPESIDLTRKYLRRWRIANV